MSATGLFGLGLDQNMRPVIFGGPLQDGYFVYCDARESCVEVFCLLPVWADKGHNKFPYEYGPSVQARQGVWEFFENQITAKLRFEQLTAVDLEGLLFTCPKCGYEKQSCGEATKSGRPWCYVCDCDMNEPGRTEVTP